MNRKLQKVCGCKFRLAQCVCNFVCAAVTDEGSRKNCQTEVQGDIKWSKNNYRMEDGTYYWDMTAKIAFDKRTGL